jgi:hypothetical protein
MDAGLRPIHQGSPFSSNDSTSLIGLVVDGAQRHATFIGMGGR